MTGPRRVRQIGPGKFYNFDTGEIEDMKTALGNDEGPSSQELWDKLCAVEHQNQLILDTMQHALRVLQQGSGISRPLSILMNRVLEQLSARMHSLREVPGPNG